MKRRQQQLPLDLQPQLRRSQRIRARTSPPLLDALAPILPLFHPFLDDAAAACLLRTSRTAALALLPGYAFTSHIFQPASLVSLRRLRDQCVAYRLRITQLALPEGITELTVGAPPHLSPIPASVTALSFGPSYDPRWAAFSAAAGDWQNSEHWRLPDPHQSWQSLTEQEKERELSRWIDHFSTDCVRSLPRFHSPDVHLDCPLPPGILPEGLRALRLNDFYNQPLQPGALPSTLTFLHFGLEYDQPIGPGVLPASLRFLSVNGKLGDRDRLLLGSLPASLERLRLDCWRPSLQVAMMPPGLKALHLDKLYHPLQPLMLPSSLLYLSFLWFDQPLHPDVLPSSLVELNLGWSFNHPLHPHVLPSSLRTLTMSGRFRQPLQVGSLPRGCCSFVSTLKVPTFLLCSPACCRPRCWASTSPRAATTPSRQASFPHRCGGCDWRTAVVPAHAQREWWSF